MIVIIWYMYFFTGACSIGCCWCTAQLGPDLSASGGHILVDDVRYGVCDVPGGAVVTIYQCSALQLVLVRPCEHVESEHARCVVVSWQLLCLELVDHCRCGGIVWNGVRTVVSCT